MYNDDAASGSCVTWSHVVDAYAAFIKYKVPGSQVGILLLFYFYFLRQVHVYTGQE